jgi:alkanesulfonate monooxygenase SsuD/methylene tetrahydromethanopterin reductase-like flavin-dependent oxidoreductase (luciferase family)
MLGAPNIETQASLRQAGRVRLGVVILPEQRWRAGGASTWLAAEALGFAHAWTYDHLAWRTLRDDPWFGAVPVLAAAAAVTSTIRLGPLVASPNFRHPVPFAREVLALDDIAGGRLTVGLGAGGEGWDASMLGHEPWARAERTERFEEFVALLDRLLTEGDVTSAGRYYAAVEARSAPGCVQRPRVPFAVAATGPRGMAVAAAFARTWVSTGERTSGEAVDAATGAEQIGRQVEQLDDACAAIGRDPNTIDRLVLAGPSLDQGLSSVDHFADTLGRYAAAGATDFVVHWPRPSDPYRGDRATFEAAISAAVG